MTCRTRPGDPDDPATDGRVTRMRRKRKRGGGAPEPATTRKPGGGTGKKLLVALLVLGVVGGAGHLVLQEQAAAEAAAADALPYVTGTQLAEEAYQAFRAQGVRVYEIDCPTVAEKELGQRTTCSAQDETGAPIGLEATTVENPVKRFEFQRI